MKYYSLDNILAQKADYNIIYGERSNGKTTAVLRYAIERHIKSDYVEQLAIVRRWEEDFKGKNGQQMFDSIVNLGWITELTGGEYNSVFYYSQRWYLCYYNEDGEKEKQGLEPFAFGFSIGSEEHYKSTAYPNITTVLFDEFMTRKYYLPNEFISYQNLLSTIIRLRDNVKIFMCGNTINKYCPYFSEMGITGAKSQKQGTIDVYTYGDSELRVAVEYSDSPSKKKASNKYFAFNNPKLQMITNGGWEIDIYPHLPHKYKPCDVAYTFNILFDGETLEGDIVVLDDTRFIYFHRRTTPIKVNTERLVYQQQIDHRRNYRTNILKPLEKVDRKICELVISEKIFYQDNEIGEIFRNYIVWCKKHT